MLALVHGVTHDQAQLGGGFLLQLPVAHGLVHTAGVALQGAFLQHQVAEIQRHAFGLQHPVDDGKRGVGHIDPGLKRGLVPAQAIGFLLHQALGFRVQHKVKSGYVEGRGHIGVEARGRGLSGQRAGEGRPQPKH